jgi:hypothetical protein
MGRKVFEMTDFIGKQTLPPHPHLDHLRKQAKARLAEMRAAQPGARLADAQHALAQDYGFSTWGSLRAEVMRLTGAPDDRYIRIQRRLKPLKHRDREVHDAAMEQATHAESHTAFFLSGAGTNIGVLFVIVAIVMALWVFTSSLPAWPSAAAQTVPSLEEQARERAERRAEQRLPRTAVPMDPKRFDAYAGVYQIDHYEFIAFTREGDHFFGAPVGGAEDQKLEFYPESPARFFAKTAPAQIEFVSNAQGQVTGFVLHSNGFEASAPKVDVAIANAAMVERDLHIKTGTPWPGTEKALRRYITAFQKGHPNYDEMISVSALLTLERFPKYSEAFRKWGALTALTFIDVTPRGFDHYRAVFAHGRGEMTVEPLDPDGKIRGIVISRMETPP